MEKIEMKENTEMFENWPLQNMSPRTGMCFRGSDMADGFDGLLWCGRAVGGPEAVALEMDR